MATNPIAYILSEEIQGGGLSRLFASGMSAIILRDDDRVRRLIELIFNWLGLDDPNARGGPPAFGQNLLSLAKNHIAGNMIAGDMLRFEPGRIVHIARKFVVYRSTIDQSLQSFPDTFHSEHTSAPVPCMIKELASSLMLELFVSAFPGSFDSLSSYAIQVEILIYPSSYSDIDGLGAILADSCGRWSRWGYEIDTYINNVYGLFDRKIIRDLYALASLLPGIRGLLGILNKRMASVSTESVPKNYFLLGRPHVDGGKYLTALAGRRDNLYTQVLGAKTWMPLHVATDTLAIFPSPEMTPQNGTPATLHRILQYDPPSNKNNAAQNISLVLAIIDRPTHLRSIGAISGLSP